MFSKLGGAKIFSTIDLRSGYYHIGLTRESRAKSAFVMPMGKWQFKRTPFGLSQAPAYFQLLIDQVLMGCSGFAMGYLDDIIIFSKTEEEEPGGFGVGAPPNTAWDYLLSSCTSSPAPYEPSV